MIRIRRVHDDILPLDRQVLAEVQAILRDRFSALPAHEIDGLPDQLRKPFKKGFRTILLVAEDARHRVLGFASVLHEPEIRLCFLDFVAAAQEGSRSGIGGSLYERVREEAVARGDRGILFECLRDDPAEVSSPAELAQNVSRLRFYERWGARPIAGTLYETSVEPGGRGAPFLVFDGLDKSAAPSRELIRRAVRAILERKYAALCPPEYVDRIVASIADDPVRLRPFRYLDPEAAHPEVSPRRGLIPLIVNDRHDIHHVRERGYVEAPARIKSILAAIEPSGMFERRPAARTPRTAIEAVHDPALVRYLERACAEVPEGKSLYPYVFPIRNATRPPRERSVLAGYFCIDTFTPIHRNAYPAARGAVDCAMTAASAVREGARVAYALVRPPGHHAERRSFGGFCYFNNAAVAAHRLSELGRVAILDVDYHHGNGQQEIFYRRSEVLTVSIHGHPRFAYPYFTGFEDERGEGEGEGANLNLPLPEARNGTQYRKALTTALRHIADFAPTFLVVCLGLDPAKGDPTGTWSLTAADFEANGEMIGELRRPTLVVQEGGYRTRTLGTNVRRFFVGLRRTVETP